MIWNILEIEETKDKKAITRAYRKKLASVNPEDKPEEFKELRAAYEEALAYAEKEEERTEKTPVDLWLEKLDALYRNFRKRIDLYAWRELLGEEIVIALDTRPVIEEVLLAYLMGHYYIPQQIWLFLDDQFSWQERAEELTEIFPDAFIRNIVLNGIRYSELLPYDLFFPDEDGDMVEKYIELYVKAINTPPEEADSVIQEMIDLPEDHPYGQALVYCAEIERGETEEGLAHLEQLCEDYEGDRHLLKRLADMYLSCGKFEQCEILCKQLLEASYDTYVVKWMLAQSIAGKGKYLDAVDLLGELMSDSGGDVKRLNILNDQRKEWNIHLIDEYNRKLEENPDDPETRFMLAWCYHQNDENEKAFELVQTLEPEQPDAFGYYNIMNSLSMEKGDFEKALEYANHLIEVVKSLVPDGTEKTMKRIGRLAEMYTRRGECLMELHREEEGLADFETALSIKPDSAEILDLMIRAYMIKKDYEKMEELAREFTQRFPELYHGYILLAMALFANREDREALDAVNTAMQIDPQDLMEYLIKARIFIRNGVFEEVHPLLDFLKDNGVENDVNVRWIEALLAEEEKTLDDRTILSMYQSIEADGVDRGMTVEWLSDFYYSYAFMTAKVQDEKKEYDRPAIYAILEKGLKADPNDFNCLDYKGWLLKKDGKVEEALAVYHTLEKQKRYNLYVERMLAELYYSELEKYADKALWYYEKLIENDDTSENRFYAGMCCMKMGNYDGAVEHFTRERELDPEDIDSYYRLTQVYMDLGRYEEALVQARKTVEMARERNDRPYRFFLDYIRLLRRLNRPMEAVEIAKEIRDNYEYAYANRIIYDIYAQFGMWKEAGAHLFQWMKKSDESEAYASKIELEMIGGRINETKRLLETYRDKIDAERYRELEARYFYVSGQMIKAIPYYEELMKKAKIDNPNTYARVRLCEIHALEDSSYEEAQSLATETITVLDAYLERFDRYRTLYYLQSGLLLAVKGDDQAARKVIENSRSMPLCGHCNYCRCKDAELYECYIELLSGNVTRALELVKAGQKNWPDEEDFRTLEVYAKRMEKEKC